MWITTRIGAALIVFAILASCERPPSSGETGHSMQAPSREAQELMSADPVRDLSAALRAGDKRFLAVSHGMGFMIPGVDYPYYLPDYDYVTIKGTGDDIDDDVQLNAIDYAEIYNRILQRYLRQRGELPSRGEPATRKSSSGG